MPRITNLDESRCRLLFTPANLFGSWWPFVAFGSEAILPEVEPYIAKQ
jgi:hypothetical protein